MTQVTFPAYTDDIGDYQSGTIIDAAFLDSIKSGIDALVHSSSNPSVTPKAIIDEVVAARGSKASIDARLDVEHNEDGTHNLSATVVTTDVLDDSLVLGNEALNGKFDDWAAGASSAPDNWTLAGTGAAIARTGVGESDTTRKVGQYAAKVTYGSATATLTQQVVQAADWNSYDYLEGDIVSFTIWIYSTTVNKARVSVQDGNTTTYATKDNDGSTQYHNGDGTWQRFQAQHTVSSAATKLDLVLQVEGTGNAVFSGACLLYSRIPSDRYVHLAPSTWKSPTYVTLGATSILSNERVLTAGKKITVTDAGAGSTVTLEGTTHQHLLLYENDITEGIRTIGDGATHYLLGGMRWHPGAGTGAVDSTTAVANHPGVARMTTGATSGDDIFGLGFRILAVDFNKIRFIVAPVTTVANVNYRLGLADVSNYNNFAAIDTPKGAYFGYSNSGNWRCITKETSSTNNDSGITPAAGTWTLMEIERSGSNIIFKINGTTVATHSTNLPANATECFVMIAVDATSNAARSLDMDYWAHESITFTQRYT